MTLKTERIQHWLGVGALPTERVARFLGRCRHDEKAAIRETPLKSMPRAERRKRKRPRPKATAAAGGAATAAAPPVKPPPTAEETPAASRLRSRPPRSPPIKPAVAGGLNGDGSWPIQTISGFVVGVIAGAHGVAGLVRLKSFTADPEDIAAYGPLEDETRRAALRVAAPGRQRAKAC